MVFTFNESRGRQNIESTLKKHFQGTLIADGYASYARFAEQTQGVTHAQCWVHSRRQFIEAESLDKITADQALDFIGRLCNIEEHINTNKLTDDKKNRLSSNSQQADYRTGFYMMCDAITATRINADT